MLGKSSNANEKNVNDDGKVNGDLNSDLNNSSIYHYSYSH